MYQNNYTTNLYRKLIRTQFFRKKGEKALKRVRRKDNKTHLLWYRGETADSIDFFDNLEKVESGGLSEVSFLTERFKYFVYKLGIPDIKLKWSSSKFHD